MASFCNGFFIAFFLLACGVFLASPGLASEAHEQYTLPQDFVNYVKQCRTKLSQECGLIFFDGIFLGESNLLTPSCCQQLVTMGIGCHNAMTEALITRPEFNDKAPLYLAKRAHVWQMCQLFI